MHYNFKIYVAFFYKTSYSTANKKLNWAHVSNNNF